jgi:hypothetical protein
MEILYNTNMLRTLAALVLTSAVMQVPVPFPRPGQPPPGRPLPPATSPAPAPAPEPAQRAPAAPAGDPGEATLGTPIYPSARFIASYDAGRGQRYYLFGAESDFVQIINYYRTVLKQKGELVFEEPPVHMFDLGRFKEETMAFPPSVTVKDYTWGGSLGYLNPKADAKPARFKTIIQIVPSPPLASK